MLNVAVAVLIDQLGEANLRDDGAELASRGRDTVCSGAIPCGKHLSRNDEGGSVWTKILEEVRETVQEDKCAPAAA